MSIPSQLPQLVAAARSGALQALALQAGQMLEGKVIGPAPNGGTQVQIAGQMLNLVLPTLVKAGETIKLEVQASGAQLKLALQPSAPQPALAGMRSNAPALAPSQPPVLPMPAAQPAQALVQQAPQSGGRAPPIPAATTPSTITPVPPQVVAQGASAPQSPPIAGQTAPAAPPPSAQAGPPVAAPVSVNAGQAAVAAPASVPATAATPATAPVAPPPAGGQTASGAPLASIGSATSVPAPTAALPVSASVAAPLAPAQPYPAATARPPVSPLPIAASAPATAVAGQATTPAMGAPIAPASIAPPVAQPMATTPQAAVAQMVQAAVPRQDTIAGLTQALTSIAGKVALPEPVVRAAQQVLAGRVAIDGGKLDAAALQKAVLASGVFQEAGLARPGALPLAPQADMKSALLTLRQALTGWLGQQAPLAATSQVAPPIRGHAPRARPVDSPSVDPKAAPEEIGKQLLDRTEAALSRVRLHQAASLPDPVARSADWSMDVPVMVGQQQTVLQLQIHRDDQSGSEAAAERGWQMRFAINLPDMGEVGAQVSLRGGTTGVMLWATERSTSEALETDAAALRSALAAAGLKTGAVIVRHGEPPTPPPAPSGHLLDAST